MKYASREFGKQYDVDWTPMIDMTFQLIAFFMFVLNFSDAEQTELVQLPQSELAKPPDQPLESPLTLLLTKDAQVLYAGNTVPVEGARHYLNLEKRFMEDNDKSPADATVIIRVDAEVATGKVQELIRICQGTGFEKFALRARQGDEPLP